MKSASLAEEEPVEEGASGCGLLSRPSFRHPWPFLCRQNHFQIRQYRCYEGCNSFEPGEESPEKVWKIFKIFEFSQDPHCFFFPQASPQNESNGERGGVKKGTWL